MINKQKYQKLKDTLYLAKHPTAKTIEEAMRAELVEVGCKIEYGGDIWTIGDSYSVGFQASVYGAGISKRFHNREHEIVIIGTPLTSDDVLVAIGKTKKEVFISPKIVGDRYIVLSSNKFNYYYWHLTKTLDNQSDPTKQFLIDLLVTPE